MLLDEYGSVVGMVTLENVLEELVGPIQDEFDRETPPITPLGENVFEVDASCPLDVLAETCGLEIPRDRRRDGRRTGPRPARPAGQAGRQRRRSTATASRSSAPIPPGSARSASSRIEPEESRRANHRKPLRRPARDRAAPK